MKIILIDDEPRAITLLKGYLEHFSGFELVGSFRNGLKALEFLNSNKVDVIFLDINMPHLSGLSLSKIIDPATAIVFTTAYSEHAVASYDVNTVDYLLKPISLERFSKCMTKLLEKGSMPTSQENMGRNEETTIFVKSGLNTHQLRIKDIEYLQKDGNYMNYHVSGKKIMARQSIGEALANLPDHFFQIQKSYIINFSKINSVATDMVVIGSHEIPIGSQYRSKLLKKLK